MISYSKTSHMTAYGVQGGEDIGEERNKNDRNRVLKE